MISAVGVGPPSNDWRPVRFLTAAHTVASVAYPGCVEPVALTVLVRDWIVIRLSSNPARICPPLVFERFGLAPRHVRRAACVMHVTRLYV